MASESILVKALPPATDYMTYLTIVEYNLTSADLPLLHDLLQDAALTMNIGWDLVMLLLPLLPGSGPCLQTIARLGNPREVVLKVTEALRLLYFDDGHITSTSGVHVSNQVSPALLEFKALLSMLSVLHKRIKAKNPSRFLSTSLQAVLVAFSRAEVHVDILLRSVCDLLIIISNPESEGSAPAVPPRPHFISDPVPSSVVKERQPHGQPSNGALLDVGIQRKLLQTFVTHVVEVYIFNAAPIANVSGVGWSKEIFETLNPDKTIPGKVEFKAEMARNENLRSRRTSINGILALGENVGLTATAMVAGALVPPTDDLDNDGNQEEEEPPNSADEIPLSNVGCLLLLANHQVLAAICGSNSTAKTTPIFPSQARLLKNFVGVEDNIRPEMLRDGPEYVIDALLSLCLLAIDANEIGEPTEEEYEQFLHTMSFISASTTSSSLRYYAHYVTTTVLRSNPSDAARLRFIGNTLKLSKYDNLKVSAVSWIKGETLEAISTPKASRCDTLSVFVTPVAIRTLSKELFPDITVQLNSSDPLESWASLETKLSFFLSSLNFYYLLISAPQLRKSLNMASFHEEEDVDARFLEPLRKAASRFRRSLDAAAPHHEMVDNDVEYTHLDLMLLDDILDRIGHAAIDLKRT